jgi:hypothetical protein
MICLSVLHANAAGKLIADIPNYTDAEVVLQVSKTSQAR